MRNLVAVVVAAVAVFVAVFIVGAVVVPLLVLLGAVADLDTLQRLFTSANVAALGETLRIGVGAVVVAVGVGVPIAVAVERTDVGGGRALAALAVLPLAVPSYLLAFAFRAAFDDRIGVFNVVARVVGDVDSVGGIVVVLGTALLPIVVVRLRATLRTIDGALEEAARIAGAGPLRALLDVTVRMSAPTVLSSAVLVFAGATAAFGVPLLLGLGAKTPIVVVTTRITLALQSGAPGAVADALALSVALALVSTSAFAIAALLTRGSRVAAGKVARPTRLQLGAWRAPLTILAWVVVVVLVVVPLASLVVQGLTLHAGHGLRLDNLGIAHLVDVVTRADVQRAAANSAMLAIAAAAIIVVVSVVVVVVRRRAAPRVARGADVLGRLLELSYALPGTVVAVTLVLAFSSELRVIILEQVTFVLALGGTIWLLLVAYVVKEAALGLRAVDEALDQIHPSLEEAARIGGARPVRAFVDVTLPLVRPHLFAAAVVVALPCFTELTMSVLLQAPGTASLGVVLFSLYEYGDPQQAMALAALLVVVVLAGQLIATRRGRSADVAVQ